MSTVMFGHVRGHFLDTPAVMPFNRRFSGCGHPWSCPRSCLVMSVVTFWTPRRSCPWIPLLSVELVGEPVGRVSVPVGRALDDYPRLG